MVQGVIIKDGAIQNVNPADGTLLGTVPVTTPEELDRIVATANDVQSSDAWSALPVDERIALLRKGVDAIAGVADELARNITSEMGKVHSEAVDEVSEASGLGGYLDMIREANLNVRLGGGEDGMAESVIVRDPLGVVVVLSPWNFPAGEIPLLVLPALAAGNTVIVKPSEVVPLSGALVCKALSSHLPPGVLQVVQGDANVGEKLVTHHVHMVAMTGSSGVGRRIMKKCAPKLKRIVLELGGKDPMIVFADADLELAAKDAVNYSLFNAGQVCCSVERIYVDSSVKDVFEKSVIEVAKKWEVGDPTKKGGLTNSGETRPRMGPMCSSMQLEKVQRQVAGALEAGAKVLYQSDVGATTGGHYHPVTVLTDLTQRMAIQKDETFGPIVAISTFDGSEDEAVRLANDTEYGLAGYVYTTDTLKGGRVARKMRSGQVGINCYSLLKAQPGCPWVGHKMSGFGSHSGSEGFRSFSVPKSLVFTTNAPS